MVEKRSVTYIEVDIDYCQNEYGVSPCQAVLGVTGADKCFNSLNTCQDRVNFINDPVTIRFAQDTDYLPIDILAIPSIVGVSFSPATISLGKDLGQRATLTVSFRDHRHSDAGAGFDKYYDERSYNPFEQGTFWGKWRARQPFLRGRAIRLIRGFVGQTLAEMDTRHYIIESFNGPTPGGEYKLTAKDVLKLADGDRAQAPAVSNGFLVAAIDADDTQLTLSPNGIGDVEYPASGYIAIGGSEILGFERDTTGIDANTLLLLHLDGPDESIIAADFIDSSQFDRVASLVGGVNLDTAQSQFGGCSAFFDGGGDGITFPDSDDWAFGTDPFTLEAWIRCDNNLGTIRCIVSAGESGSPTARWRFRVLTTGALNFRFEQSGSINFDLSSAAGEIVLDTWYHIALVRSGNTFTIYKNGTSVASGSSTISLPNYLTTLFIGIGPDSSIDPMHGWIDELRISDVARFTANFTAPVRAYADSDIMFVTRGQLGTTATTHDVQDRVQLCLQYVGEDPADIIYDLLTTYAVIPVAYINLIDWLNETQSFLQRLYGATIAEPTDVSKLVSELVEQAALAIWWDDANQSINLKVLRAIATDAFVFDDENTLEGTLQVSDQPNLRASQVWTYYGQRNPLRPIDEPDNFRSTLATVNLQSESDEGQPAILKIFARWIPAFGRDTAERLNDIQLGRFQVPPRRFTFEVFRGSVDDPILGSGYQVGNWSLQDAFGALTLAPIQITRLNPVSEKFTVEAEEMLFAQLDPADLIDRTIIIDSNINNVNLRTIHDGIFPEPVAFESPSITVTCIIESEVIVGSSESNLIAFDIGTWPGGVTIHMVVNGEIRGAGGDGGQGGNASGSDPAGQLDGEDGGTALYTRYPITIEDVNGILYGGGGGGGGGFFRGGGGGGGAGVLPGDGGPIGTSEQSPSPGSPGTQDQGGAGGDGGGASDLDGGEGGDPGEAGDNGEGGGGIGGAAGAAIDGISFVTQVGAIGDRKGGQVN